MGFLYDAERRIYGFVISKHTSLFYKLESDSNIVLNIFDNKRNPKSRI